MTLEEMQAKHDALLKRNLELEEAAAAREEKKAEAVAKDDEALEALRVENAQLKFNGQLPELQKQFKKANGKAGGFDVFVKQNKEALVSGKSIDDLKKENEFFFDKDANAKTELNKEFPDQSKEQTVNAGFVGRSFNRV